MDTHRDVSRFAGRTGACLCPLLAQKRSVCDVRFAPSGQGWTNTKGAASCISRFARLAAFRAKDRREVVPPWPTSGKSFEAIAMPRCVGRLIAFRMDVRAHLAALANQNPAGPDRHGSTLCPTKGENKSGRCSSSINDLHSVVGFAHFVELVDFRTQPHSVPALPCCLQSKGLYGAHVVLALCPKKPLTSF